MTDPAADRAKAPKVGKAVTRPAAVYQRIEIDRGRGWSVVAWRRIEAP